jgi:hypothetical protein
MAKSRVLHPRAWTTIHGLTVMGEPLTCFGNVLMSYTEALRMELEPRHREDLNAQCLETLRHEAVAPSPFDHRVFFREYVNLTN